MVTIKNEYLEVELNAKGAEIIKIIGNVDNLNYMWKRDPKLWANSAPILFPIVGSLKNNECRIDGSTYSMTQHGFARHNEFTTMYKDANKVIFNLKSNEEIIKQYPYLFDLDVEYSLNGNKLSCKCIVKNIDNKEIYFQIGGHPAFACPLLDNESSNDYYVEFEKNEVLNQRIIDINKGGMSHNTELLFDDEKRFFVRQRMFENNAVVVKDFKSNYVAIKSLVNHKSIVFHMDGFTHLGIWSGNHVGGLLAIEPWVGHTDYIDFTGEFKEKEGIVKLDCGKEFTCCFTIEINQ